MARPTPIVTFENVFRGSLLESASFSLAQALIHFDQVFSLTPSFRIDEVRKPNCLSQFTYLEMHFKGNFEMAITQAEGLLAHARDMFLADGGSCRSELEFDLPLRRLDFREAVSSIGSGVESDLELPDQLRIVENFGSKPVVVTNIPAHLKPFEFDIRGSDGIALNFDLLVPWAGEIGSGSELESDKEILFRLARNSPLLRGLMDIGEPEEALDAYVGLVVTAGGQAQAGLSVERIAQFLNGATDIIDVCPFASSSDRVRIFGDVGKPMGIPK